MMVGPAPRRLPPGPPTQPGLRHPFPTHTPLKSQFLPVSALLLATCEVILLSARLPGIFTPSPKPARSGGERGDTG